VFSLQFKIRSLDAGELSQRDNFYLVQRLALRGVALAPSALIPESARL
jgi:hypothetical protein